MPLAEIRAILEASPSRRRANGVWLLGRSAWWSRSRKTNEIERTRRAVLDAAWRLPSPLFFVPADPVDHELTPLLERDGAAWRIDRTRSARALSALEPVSTYGNWQIYAAAEPLTVRLPDTFRASPREILSLMAANGVLLLVDAFHDNSDWCIALLDGESQPPRQ